jgi:DNA-binding transcriptional regulator YiaG
MRTQIITFAAVVPPLQQPQPIPCQDMPMHQPLPSGRPLRSAPSGSPIPRPSLQLVQATPEPGHPTFSRYIKALRQRFGGKQWWLAYVSGCSDAAVSYWESGKRIPGPETLAKILDALLHEGASAGELATLRRCWVQERGSRRGKGGLTR